MLEKNDKLSNVAAFIANVGASQRIVELYPELCFFFRGGSGGLRVLTIEWPREALRRFRSRSRSCGSAY